MTRYYIERNRLEDSPGGKYRYEYKVQCRVCESLYWTKNYPSKQAPRCKRCAGRQTYQPSKVIAINARSRGDGYITKQGYHLVFDGAKYVPAHRLSFPDLAGGEVVHHIDGDKLNNALDNLIPLSKRAHREAHGSLERVAYYLIQRGLIDYDRSTNTYALSSAMKQLVECGPTNNPGEI